MALASTDPFAPAPPPAPTEPTFSLAGLPKNTAARSGAKPAPKPETATQQSAHQLLIDMLDQWGLGSLAANMWKEYLQGTPQEKIMADIRSSKAYAARFPGMAELQKQGRTISEADYIAKESADASLLHAYGMDRQGTDRQFLGRLIGGEVSTSELQTRLDTYKQTVLQLPHEVRDYLSSQEGIHTGDLMSFWLNPDQALPDLQAKASAAQVGGAAAIAGYGALDPKVAARLAGLGVDFGGALSGFGQAAQLKGLTQNLPGQVNDAVTSDDLVNALVGGDGQAALRVQKTQAQRKAQFSDNESVATTSQGAVGLAQTGV